MPIDDLTALGQKMREARKKKDLTQQELADLSHVSVKQIANIEKGKMNPSYLILRALAKVLHISLDTLINPDISLEDEGVNQMKMLYSSCPPEMRDTLLHHTQETVKELTEHFFAVSLRPSSFSTSILGSFAPPSRERISACAARYSSRSASCSARNFRLYFVALYCSKIGRVLAY